MRNPTKPQMTVLLAAVSHGGRLPANAFAYAGYFFPYGGTEKIAAALRDAAHATTPAVAAKLLLDRLDHSQLRMAGGFLGVERDSSDGRGDLAERYATAIHTRHGRIEGTSVASVRACIRAGWLTEKWEITTEGRNAAFYADTPRYHEAMRKAAAEDAARYADTTTDAAPATVLTGASSKSLFTGETGSGKTNLVPFLLHELEAAGAAVIVDEAHTTGEEVGTVATLTNEIMRMGRDERMVFVEPRPSRRPYRTLAELEAVLTTAPAPAGLEPEARAIVSAAMAGYRHDELTPAEQAAAARGIPPRTYRQLYPAITNPVDLDALHDMLVVRDELVRRLTDAGREDAARTIAGDPREAGYRVALTLVRRARHTEAIRRGAFHLELALTGAVNGHDKTVTSGLAKAAAALAT